LRGSRKFQVLFVWPTKSSLSRVRGGTANRVNAVLAIMGDNNRVVHVVAIPDQYQSTSLFHTYSHKLATLHSRVDPSTAPSGELDIPRSPQTGRVCSRSVHNDSAKQMHLTSAAI